MRSLLLLFLPTTWHCTAVMLIIGAHESQVDSAAFGIQQYHFSILKAKPTISICTENIDFLFSIPNTALQVDVEMRCPTLENGNDIIYLTNMSYDSG
jgi:hypothetical protein